MTSAASASLLFASAAGVLSHGLSAAIRPGHNSDADVPGDGTSALTLIPRRAITGRRRAVLVDAVGRVYGTEEGLAAVARARVLAALTAVVVSVLLVVVRFTPLSLMAAICAVAAGWQMPLILARGRERRRRAAFDIELTDALGEMVMGVEAGLTLESVMRVYAQSHTTSLASEFAHVLDVINLGVPRMEALAEFSGRTPTAGVRTFVSAVQQNQKLGTPLAQVLRQQGETARRRRRQAVEEYSAKLSLKMIFPTVFCILPMLLIVIVGPAIVRLVHSLPG